jgi:hypothetical protein
MDDSVRFWNEPWAIYKAGFGDLLTNSWLGLDHIHVLTTKDPNVVLRIELQGNRCKGPNCGNSVDERGFWFAEWNFSVSISLFSVFWTIQKGLLQKAIMVRFMSPIIFACPIGWRISPGVHIPGMPNGWEGWKMFERFLPRSGGNFFW